MQQLTPNTILQGGKYRILNELGHGACGVTYLALNNYTQEQVAIKEFYMHEYNSRLDDGTVVEMKEGSMTYNYAQKFKKEAMALASIHHPNIIHVSDIFDENNTHYYVMEYIDGQNLYDYSNSHQLSTEEAKGIISEVAKGLIYMHEEKRMLHLDMKPGNVMRRSSDGHIFIIDFGLSKHFDKDGMPESSTTIGQGTQGYAPTEQANQARNGEFRPTIDVYALGGTLFRLLTRDTPPHASEVLNDMTLLPSILKRNNVDSVCSATILKAMYPTVTNRTQSVRAFVNMLNSTTVQDEETTLDSDSALLPEPSDTTQIHNFSYPFTININKKIHTDCQSWTIHSLVLQRSKSILKMTVQSLDEATTAWSGTGRITTNEGKVLKQISTNLPRRLDNSFIIDPWNTYSVEDVYPAIDRDSSGFSIVNQSIIIPNIEINNGQCFVPDANTEDFQGITRDELAYKRQKRNGTNSNSTGCGLWIAIGVITLIALAI